MNTKNAMDEAEALVKEAGELAFAEQELLVMEATLKPGQEAEYEEKDRAYRKKCAELTARMDQLEAALEEEEKQMGAS